MQKFFLEEAVGGGLRSLSASILPLCLSFCVFRFLSGLIRQQGANTWLHLIAFVGRDFELTKENYRHASIPNFVEGMLLWTHTGTFVISTGSYLLSQKTLPLKCLKYLISRAITHMTSLCDYVILCIMFALQLVRHQHNWKSFVRWITMSKRCSALLHCNGKFSLYLCTDF